MWLLALLIVALVALLWTTDNEITFAAYVALALLVGMTFAHAAIREAARWFK